MNIIESRYLISAALLFHSSLSCLALNYSDIQNHNASCFPKDTCSTPRDLDDTDNHNCDCGSACLLYDTCCIDSPFSEHANRHELRRRPASCLPAGQSGGSVFMTDFCPTDYDGPIAVRHACEDDEKDWRDPIANIPVTNMASQITYKSLSCAICNGERSSNLTMWHITIDCASLNGNARLCSRKKNFVINNMIFDQNKRSWGLWSWDADTDWQFRTVAIAFRMPSSLDDSVKQCRPNLVSDCDPSWDDFETRELCKKYMAAIYFPDIAYRNIHCAICNRVTDMADMSCHDLTASPFRSIISMSFGLLLDMDLSDGDQVGKVDNDCQEGQVFDPFSKKCRTLSCALPGYTLQNRKCIRSS